MMKPGEPQLNEMIAEALVDAHDQDEALLGFHSLIVEQLAVPFKTVVLGVPVTVENIGLASHGLTATCVSGKYRQEIHLVDLPLPTTPPRGCEWVAAYRLWARRA
ncbi:MAG TPA: hypothetical protein VNV62_16985 [Trebonia sp.]|nr:hypothetical protein [Trebonia sp.]